MPIKWLKIVNVPIYNQIIIKLFNWSTPLVSLDNSSNLTISDLFVAHSSFHPIDPENGLKLSSLLTLCSFSAVFAVGEDNILAFYFWLIASSSFSFETQKGCVKNVIFVKRLYWIFKKWCLFTVSKLKIKNKASLRSPQNQLSSGWMFSLEKYYQM